MHHPVKENYSFLLAYISDWPAYYILLASFSLEDRTSVIKFPKHLITECIESYVACSFVCGRFSKHLNY